MNIHLCVTKIMVAGCNILTNLAAFLEMAAQDPCSALNSLSSRAASCCTIWRPLHRADSLQRPPIESQLHSKFFSGADRWAQHLEP